MGVHSVIARLVVLKSCESIMRRQCLGRVSIAGTVFFLTALCPAWCHAQGDTLLARPDFQNGLFDPAAAIPELPFFRQASSLTLLSGGVWDSRVAGTPSDGGIQLVQAIIGQPVAPAAFWYLAPAPLPVQSRFRDERLTRHSAIDPAGRYRNHYAPLTDLIDAEHGAYLKGVTVSGLALDLVDGASGASIESGQSISGDPAESLLLFTLSASENDTVRVASATGGEEGRYEIALYPVLRPDHGALVLGTLSSKDRSSTNRSGAVGAGLWYFDDYLLQGVRTGERIVIRVEAAEFAPFIEARFLSDEQVQDYHEGTNKILEVRGTEAGPRDYLIRVTSAVNGALGGYRVAVSRIPEVWSFSPTSGAPGTWVTVRGTNFLQGFNPLVTGVKFAGISASLGEPVNRGGWQEFEAQVPLEAVSGPITVSTQGAEGSSANHFVVLASVTGLRREADGALSFAVSNSVGGIRNVVEAANDLNPPIAWNSVATNSPSIPGFWRWTNDPSGPASRQFYRVKVQ
jgi:hypothetical protein